jgi:protein-S-isoprenylcysteine O-methyltransferase Ste14
MNHNEPDIHGPGVRIHPPLIFGFSILCGMGLDRLHSLPIPGIEDGRLAGGITITIAILIALWALIGFYRADTDVRPDRPDSALITSGPYRYSRNPLYIVLTLVQVTAALWLNMLWVLLLAPVSTVIINYYAVVREERYLEQRFGPVYLDYKRRVRRWL